MNIFKVFMLLTQEKEGAHVSSLFRINKLQQASKVSRSFKFVAKKFALLTANKTE